MVNIEITNNSTRGIVVWEPVFDDETFTAAGAETYVAGTVLGRLTADSKLVPYASGGAGGAEIPVAVLLDDLEADAAGDIPIRPILSGQVRANDLIEHGVGAITSKLVFDQLRDYSIIALSTTQLSELDNQ